MTLLQFDKQTQFAQALPLSCLAANRRVTLACWLLQIVIAVMHLGRYAVGGETLSVLVSFQILLLWVKIQYFAR